METVSIRKVKRPDGNLLWQAYVVGEDSDGTWLFTPQGSMCRGEAKDQVVTCAVGRPEPPGLAVLHLVPTGGWWFAQWALDGDARRIAMEICRPPQHVGPEWSFVDLELDLLKVNDDVEVLDEDEFADAITAGLISEEERHHAVAAAEGLEHRLRSHDPLFDDLAWRHLAELSSQPFAPLPALA